MKIAVCDDEQAFINEVKNDIVLIETDNDNIEVVVARRAKRKKMTRKIQKNPFSSALNNI